MSAKDTIMVVLGYPTEPDGSPSPILKVRLDKAVELYKQGKADMVIVTGAAVDNEHVESKVMAAYCVANGIPESKILVETNAKNTYENARMVHNMMKDRHYSHAIVVTSSFHQMRAEQFFSEHMNNVQVITAPFPDKFPKIKQWYFLLKEHLIMTLYKAGLLNSRYSIQRS